MSSVVVAGDVSGSVTLQAPSAAGSVTVTLPASSGTMTVNGPAFSANQTTTVTPSSNTSTKITIDSKSFDTNNNFNSSTNRFTPTVAGYYQFNGNALIQGATATNLSDIGIYKNGAGALSGTVFYSAATAYTSMQCSVSGLLYMNGTTDYVELFGRVIGTGALSISAGVFSGVLVRGA